MRPVRTAFAGALLSALALAGCGQSPAPTTAASSAGAATPAPSAKGFPATVEAGNGSVTITARPERIVSLSPTATETLFAVGAGPQVVAVDDQSNHPAEAPRTDLSGFKPNAEAIIAQKPDLVVLATDTDGIVAKLGKVGVPVLLEPAAAELDEAYDQITDLGAATGNQAKAEEVVAGMKKKIEEVVAAAPKDKKLTYYHELDTTPYSVTSTTFVGQVYALFGLTNIADKAPDLAGGYPKLSAEFVAQADPDLIFLADTKCCGQSGETLAKRPGWSKLSAVTGDRVIALDDDVASRWGPRVADLAQQVGEAVSKAASE
ncbi:ABC transporter substrate-binding protein [Planomonospora sp. ID91781]|uniref:ABC transporter substrate-binding protein n=3 Tax=Planomonospora TaxID=1998 RepID=A0A171CEV3_9ACTN|nr:MULTISPECIES: ABC transporter substrate-binding protein [Planomonospora]MBG0821810.1 ABC transporter substrate-binding protein [Planomonospora sp. ID91781]GAT66606.1 ABC transporter substrate-binding protein [Planomonospora sphaerica]GGK45769.1 ABC transporter substrate-binding protein [Planomonospora parontospora]GII06375.1 ABC transporter substrate-binding protein [Planomonospora parontospora subsp. parontospora]